jgi:hypothetical protein
MRIQNTSTIIVGATLPLLAGCGLLRAGVITVVAAVGLAGYVVYETGDALVSGTKAVTGETAKAVATVVFFNGDFKTEHPYGIRFVTLGATTALRDAGFRDVRKSGDALSGEVTAQTHSGTEIRITLKNIDAERTAIVIRVGVTGNIEESEKINSIILQELDSYRARTA